MYDIFDENAFESENDENLNRKFDYNDQAIKHFYHQVCKLPSNKKYSWHPFEYNTTYRGKRNSI